MRDILLDIPCDNPFKNDQFEREIIAKNFMKIFDSDEKGVVLAIDSNFGTGKTTFIKMWESLINNDNRYKDSYCPIYFNAWDNDYIEDPLLAIFTEMKLREKSEGDQVNLAPEIFKEIFKPIYLVAKRGVDIGLKLGTAGSIGVDEFKTKEDDTQEKILEKMNEISDEVLNRCTRARMLREEFKEKLSEFSKGYNKKLIFFIDELDRCRPSFAIELLETIKHLFSVPGVIFVVSLDKEQLSHSIETIYGKDMDTSGYLKRFFDIEYKLPNADRLKYMGIKNKETFNGYINTKYFKQFLDGFIIGYNFSLRDVDKLHNYMKILMPLIEEYREDKWEEDNIIVKSYLYAYLISLKIKRPNLYNKIMDVDYDYDPNTYDEVLRLNETYKFDFYKERGLEKELINIIQKDVIKNFLALNYLSCTKPKEIYKMQENTFTVKLGLYNQVNMIYFFKPGGSCSIKSNMEFMNSLGE